MITSSQIIAKSQAEISSKLNMLLQLLPNAATEFASNIIPFGSNQFAIIVTYNLVGGLRSFSNNVAICYRTTVSKLHAKGALVPLLGLKATIKLFYNELFVNRPLLGLLSKRFKLQTKNPRPLLGLKIFIKGKQTPTREKALLGVFSRVRVAPYREKAKLGLLIGLRVHYTPYYGG
jgi:hypothetical protein